MVDLWQFAQRNNDKLMITATAESQADQLPAPQRNRRCLTSCHCGCTRRHSDRPVLTRWTLVDVLRNVDKLKTTAQSPRSYTDMRTGAVRITTAALSAEHHLLFGHLRPTAKKQCPAKIHPYAHNHLQTSFPKCQLMRGYGF
ncbi:hypothetical protein T05_9418 [Trichinella murrelli]|uniref:Uncharacterized protein n=1 Tax=Trichinella murrelli TaxID=144512 RepID=A0A0V0TGD9_9BILA|nr:hypothetical protein T05_9418 [Trichinella murrelli]